MKICWDNLEGMYLNKDGFLKKGNSLYVYKKSCACCGNAYLGIKTSGSKFCSNSCVNSGRTRTVETRKKISVATKGKNNPFFGKTHTIETRKRMSRESRGNKEGSLNPNYKGGIYTRGLAAFNTYKDTLGSCEDVRKQKNTEILEVKCAYCGRWFAPTYKAVRSRLDSINNLNQGECRLYCSENCKQACPTFHKMLYPKGLKHTTSREVNPYLRQLVLERDNWTCQICGKTINEAQLHVHHMDPVSQNPMFQNDADSCITLCKGCHKMVHSRRGCRYIDLVCKKVG